MSRKHRENQNQYLARNGWWCDQSGRLWRHATLAPIDGMPLFKKEAVDVQRAKDRRAVAA